MSSFAEPKLPSSIAAGDFHGDDLKDGDVDGFAKVTVRHH